MPTLAQEFNNSLSTVHDYIEEQRKLLRAQTIDLAAQERDRALQLIDNAIEQVVPHINGDVLVQTEEKRETSASLSDVASERRAVEKVVRTELGVLCTRVCVLELVSWETRAWPGLGRDAQDVINEQTTSWGRL
jgi:hypothetical protein